MACVGAVSLSILRILLASIANAAFRVGNVMKTCKNGTFPTVQFFAGGSVGLCCPVCLILGLNNLSSSFEKVIFSFIYSTFTCDPAPLHNEAFLSLSSPLLPSLYTVGLMSAPVCEAICFLSSGLHQFFFSFTPRILLTRLVERTSGRYKLLISIGIAGRT